MNEYAAPDGPHPVEDLALHLRHALDDQETRRVEAHLAACASCRDELTVLRQVNDSWQTLPPEAFIEGPAPDSELLLQRTIRAARTESNRRWRRNLVAAGVAALVLAGAGLTGGLILGRHPGPGNVASTRDSTTMPPSGATSVSSRDSSTGASIAATLTPATGWVRVSALVSGIPAGQKCRLIIIGADGTRESAGSWVVSADGAANGTELYGFALVDPDDVRAVEVESVEGETFVVAPI